jgi:hypothetical protein
MWGAQWLLIPLQRSKNYAVHYRCAGATSGFPVSLGASNNPHFPTKGNFPVLNKRYNMKTYGGMEVSGQLHSTITLPLGKEPTVNVGYEAGWAPKSVWTLWRREKSLSCRVQWRHFNSNNNNNLSFGSTAQLRTWPPPWNFPFHFSY